MYAVIFEVYLKEEGKDEYLAIAAKLKEQLVKVEGFISVERFESIVTEGKLLSLSFWEDEKAIRTWKGNLDHLMAQRKGKEELFSDYRIRISEVKRDYSM